MAIFARAPESSFEPCPEGLHHAVCVDVVDLGLQQTPFGDKLQVQLRFQVEELNSQGHRCEVRKTYTNSLSEKANLRKDLESWRGRKFTGDELKGFDLEKLLGANCQLNVVHNLADNGNLYANINGVVPAPKGAVRLVPQDYVRQKDRPVATKPGGPSAPALTDDSIPF